MTSEPSTRYRAFISYSRKDQAWARWLHHKLETYHLPRSVSALGGARRLNPCFLDREELSAARDLSEALKAHLDASDSIVVICSPAAAASRYVNEEIRYFQSEHQDRPVFAFIVEGEPNASNGPGDVALECFPDALRWDHTGSERVPHPAPLAADARPWADGKWPAFLKIVAGVARVPYADLSRRDLKRRRRQWAWWSVVAATVVVAGVWTLLTWRQAEQRSRGRRLDRELATLTGASPLDLLEAQALPDGGLVFLRAQGVEIREGDTGAIRLLVPLLKPRLLQVPNAVGNPVLVEFEQPVRGPFGLAESLGSRSVVALDPGSGSLTRLGGQHHPDAQFRAWDAGGLAALLPAPFWSRGGRVQWLATDGTPRGVTELPEEITAGGGSPQGLMAVGSKKAWLCSSGQVPVPLPLPKELTGKAEWIAVHGWGGLLKCEGSLRLVRPTVGGWSQEDVKVPGGEELLRRSLQSDRFWTLLNGKGKLCLLDRASGQLSSALDVARDVDPLLQQALDQTDVVVRVSADGRRIWVVYLTRIESFGWRIEIGATPHICRLVFPATAVTELNKASLAGPDRPRLASLEEAGRALNNVEFGDLVLVETEGGGALWIASRDRMIRVVPV